MMDRDPGVPPAAKPTIPPLAAPSAASRTLKAEINDLVWKHLPAETTLGEADKVAVQIYDLIVRR